MQIFLPDNFVNIPNGPFAELTTNTTSTSEKKTCTKEKKELYNCDKNLDLMDGVYINSMPLTVLGLFLKSDL